MRVTPGVKARGRWLPALGFKVSARGDATLDRRARKALAERFVLEAIEANGLLCGGGVFGPGATMVDLGVLVVSARTWKSCTNRDRLRVGRWLAAQHGIVDVRVGALVATGDDYRYERPKLSRPRGGNPLERARRLRAEALVAYRAAAEVLSRPEVRLAVGRLNLSAALAEAALDEVLRPVLRKLGPSKRKPETDSDRNWDLANRLEHALDEPAPHGRHRARWKELSHALYLVRELYHFDGDVICIPDLHEFERNLVPGSRVAIEEAWGLLKAPARFVRAEKRGYAEGIRRWVTPYASGARKRQGSDGQPKEGESS